VQIEGLSEWSYEEIVDMAYVARDAVLVEHMKEVEGSLGIRKSKDRPSTTSTIVVGNTAYITSSMKAGQKGSYLYLPDVPATTLRTQHCREPLRTALANCQLKRFEITKYDEGHASQGVSLAIHPRMLVNANPRPVSFVKNTMHSILFRGCSLWFRYFAIISPMA
jgi:hypothetical protein